MLGAEYFEKKASVPVALGVGFAVTEPIFAAVLLFMLVGFLFAALLGRINVDLPRSFRPILWFWLACQVSLMSLLASGLDSENLAQFVKTDLHFTTLVVFTFMLVKFCSLARLRALLLTYYSLGVISALFAILQLFHHETGMFGWMSNLMFNSADYGRYGIGFRTSSFFTEPSWAARYFVHWFALSLAFLATDRRVAHVLLALLFLIAFVISASLSGYSVLLTFLVILSLHWLRTARLVDRRITLPIVGCALTAIGVWGMLALTGLFSLEVPGWLVAQYDRLNDVWHGEGGFAVRNDTTLAGMKLWLQHVAVGVGLGNARFHMQDFFLHRRSQVRDYLNADNAYTQLLAEVGIVGTIAFLFVAYRMVSARSPAAHSMFHSLHGDKKFATIVYDFLRWDLCAQFVGMFNYGDVLTPHTWFMFGVALSLQETLSNTPVVARHPLAMTSAPGPNTVRLGDSNVNVLTGPETSHP